MYKCPKFVLFLILCFLLGAQACAEKKEGRIIVPYPIVIDTIENKGEPEVIDYLNTANYQMFYIGKVLDTVMVDRHLWSKFHHLLFNIGEQGIDLPPAEFSQYHSEIDDVNTKHLPAAFNNLIIRVDTSQRIAHSHCQYPLFIINPISDTTIIAYNNKITAIMEAKDKEGNWRPIEETLKGCGTFVDRVKFPPNEMVLSSVTIYKGEFKTKLRVRIGQSVSNSFFGSINLTQFESKFDKNGAYKRNKK